jgi:hypothetical protein
VTQAPQALASCGIKTVPRQHADVIDAAPIEQGLDGRRYQVAA